MGKNNTMLYLKAKKNPFKIECYTKEVLGKFIISYMEEDYIWAYDEISMGLYKINVTTRIVEPLLSPTQINKDKILKIRGIIKRKDEIILVPQSINNSWVIYDINSKNVKYIYPFSSKHEIVEVKQRDNIVYLIPLNTNEQIFLISLKNMKCIKKIANWYTITKEKDELYYCHGSIIYEDSIFFPVNQKNYIYKLNEKEIEIFTINSVKSIISMSVNRDGIWVLPANGNYIYHTDQEGGLLENVKLETTNQLLANQFARIVNTEEHVFLFPHKGNIIHIYIKKKKEFVKIGSEECKLWGDIFVNIDCSYWDYHIRNGNIYILPLKYRYMSIDLSTLETCEDKLIYSRKADQNHCKVWYSWAVNNSKKRFLFDGEKENLSELFQLTDVISFAKKKHCISDVGQKIWNLFK